MPAERAGRIADGVVVGSALVQIIERYGQDEKAITREASAFIRSLKAPLRRHDRTAHRDRLDRSASERQE